MTSDAAFGRHKPIQRSSQREPRESGEAPAANTSVKQTGAWTDDLVLRLRELWAQGLTASQIAAALPGFSRNAILGKVHRLKLSSRPPPLQRRRPRRPTLASLSDGMCKWPVGEPGMSDFHFCGQETVANSPYCTEHHRRAYVLNKK